MTDSLHPLLARSIEANIDAPAHSCGCYLLQSPASQAGWQFCSYHQGFRDAIDAHAEWVAEQLAPLREMAEAASKATPGPWVVPVANVFRVIAPDEPHNNPKQGMTPPYPWRVVAEMGDPDGSAADAAFIAKANPKAIQDLLAALSEETLVAFLTGASE